MTSTSAGMLVAGFERVDGVHADPLVRKQNIAHTQHHGAHRVTRYSALTCTACPVFWSYTCTAHAMQGSKE